MRSILLWAGLTVCAAVIFIGVGLAGRSLVRAESVDSPIGTGAGGATIQIPRSTFAVLTANCTAAHMGQMFIITDATAGVEGANCAGSGTAVQLAVCNGTNWKCLSGGT